MRSISLVIGYVDGHAYRMFAALTLIYVLSLAADVPHNPALRVYAAFALLLAATVVFHRYQGGESVLFASRTFSILAVIALVVLAAWGIPYIPWS